MTFLLHVPAVLSAPPAGLCLTNLCLFSSLQKVGVNIKFKTTKGEGTTQTRLLCALAIVSVRVCAGGQQVGRGGRRVADPQIDWQRRRKIGPVKPTQ